MHYLLESHFGLQDTFKRTINESSQWKFRNLYSTPKPVVKMKFNKLLAARMITSIHARRGRAVKLKPIRCQVAINKFNSCICRQCIHDYSTRNRDFRKKESMRERIAKLLHSVTIEHPTKSGKLNEVGKIFPDLFDLNKYTLTTMISCIIDDVDAIYSFQNNGSELMRTFYCLQMIIIINNKDWHDKVTYQNFQYEEWI
jgi:hypothetical protein